VQMRALGRPKSGSDYGDNVVCRKCRYSAKPILRTLCQRWVKARLFSKKSFLILSPALCLEQVGPSDEAPPDALMFDWEGRIDLSTPLGVRSGDEQGVGKSSFTLLDWRVP
jgi:hypothetical protein